MSALLPDFYEAALGEDLYVLRNGGPAHVKFFCHGIQVQGPVSDHIDDLPARGIRYGLEYVSSHSCNRMVTQIYVKPFGYSNFFRGANDPVFGAVARLYICCMFLSLPFLIIK